VICRMDAASSFNLEIRIIGHNTRARWFSFDKVVDADTTNFRDLVEGVVDKYAPRYGDLVKMSYFCLASKVNVPVCSDQDLLEMFEKHKASKCCYITFAYHNPSTDPPPIPNWDLGSTSQSVELPFTPSLPCPSNPQPGQPT
jgi:hypothetical protein